MTRRLAVALLLVLVPAVVAGDDKARAKPKRGWLGVMIGYGKDKKSILVIAVLPDSPAKKAGLKESDVLVQIDGAKPADLPAMVKVIQSLKPGKKVKLGVLRDGKPKEIAVVPGELSE